MGSLQLMVLKGLKIHLNSKKRNAEDSEKGYFLNVGPENFKQLQKVCKSEDWKIEKARK